MKSFVACFLIQGNDQIKIQNPKNQTFSLFSICRVRSKNLQNSDSTTGITLFIEDRQQQNIRAFRLDDNQTFRVLNEVCNSLQIFITKEGEEDIRLFIVSEEASPHFFFSFYSSQKEDIVKIKFDQADQNLTNERIYPEIYKTITNEIRRINNNSTNQLLLLCLSLHTFFPFSVFTRINQKRIGKLDFWKNVEKILYVQYNKIKKEKVLEEFKKCIDYLDFQITIDNDLSFGIAFFIVTFLRFFEHQIIDLTKFFYGRRNFLIFLTTLTLIPKTINETLFSQFMSFPLDHRIIDDQTDEVIISNLYQFMLINCVKNKYKIYFNFTYLNLFKKVVPLNEELDYFFLYNNVIGFDNLNLSKSLSRPKFQLSDSYCLNFKVSPFDELVKKEKLNSLKLESNCEFEKNDVFKTDKVYNLWFKMKLAKKAKKHLCRYAPVYIKPLSDVDENLKNTTIYVIISLSCLLFFVVILLKFT